MKRNAVRRCAARFAAFASLVVAAGWAMPASGQTFPSPWEDGTEVGATYLPTRAGTEIENVATATFTDANDNTYSAVSDTVTVTVGLVPNIQVTRIGDDDQGVTPGGEYTYFFQITNLTNDEASPVLNLTLDPAILDPQQFCYKVYDADGTEKSPAVENCYDTYAAFKAAIEAIDLDIHEYIVISVTVEVLSGGGSSTDIVVEVPTVVVDGNSLDNEENDNEDKVTLVIGDVDVDAEFDEVDRLPSNGVEYTARFTVNNFQAVNGTFDLTTGFDGANDAGIVITRIARCSDLSTPITSVSILAGEDEDICVVYTVAFVDAGSETTITLTVTDQARTYVTDTDSTTVTVIRPALEITKKAYRDDDESFDGSAEIVDPETVIPGEFFWYEIRVRNVGSAEAVTVAIEDDLDLDYLNYIDQTNDGGTSPAWTDTGQNTLLGQIRAQLASLATADGERWIRIRVQVK